MEPELAFATKVDILSYNIRMSIDNNLGSIHASPDPRVDFKSKASKGVFHSQSDLLSSMLPLL